MGRLWNPLKWRFWGGKLFWELNEFHEEIEILIETLIRLGEILLSTL